MSSSKAVRLSKTKTASGRSSPGGEQLTHATVERVDEEGHVFVTTVDSTRSVRALILQNSLSALAITEGDRVLLAEIAGCDPVIMGVLAKRQEVVDEDSAAELGAVVDGKRLKIVGEQEIRLECGRASITLKRDGKIIVRGVDVSTRASGRNKIMGATVNIN